MPGTSVQSLDSSEISTNVADENTFISTWNTTLVSSGSSSILQIRLPLHEFGTYDFTVDWGDGSSDTITSWNQAEVLHSYAIEGEYELQIDGEILGWRFDTMGDRNKIVDISQWGDLRLGILGNHFSGAENLRLTATDPMNMSGTTTLDATFRNTDLGDAGVIDNWDVSEVTSMMNMFYGDTTFNMAIGGWNVSSVTHMDFMFFGAESFNQPLDTWDVSSVTNMRFMFSGASSYSQDMNNWNTSSVTEMRNMFEAATAFNGMIDSWNMSGVTEVRNMFEEASSFNQPIDNWDLTIISNIDELFHGASTFNQPLASWNTSGITSMVNTFLRATAFNQPLTAWDVSGVTAMNNLFSRSGFDQPIDNWDVSNVTSLSGMFQETTFNQPLGSWDVSSVTNMWGVFYQNTAFNQPLSSWNMSQVEQIGYMFDGATAFNQPIGDWDVSKVDSMTRTFAGAELFNQPLANWDTSSVTHMNIMFFNSGFNQPLGNWNVSQVRTMANMFDSTSFNQDVNNWDVSNVIDTRSMFYNAQSFDQSIANWNVSSVTHMDGMFRDVTISTTNYDAMLASWSLLNLRNDTYFDAGNSIYTNQGARQSIIDNFNWVITDGGYLDQLSPDIDSPADLEVDVADQFSATIEWTVGDLNPDKWNVTLDGTLYDSGSWTNGSISVSLNGVELGAHTFVVYVYDKQGNVASDEVIVTIVNSVTSSTPDETNTDITTDSIDSNTPPEDDAGTIDMQFSTVFLGFVAIGFLLRRRKKSGIL